MLGVLLTSERTTSSQLNGGGFLGMSPGSLSLERTGGVHHQGPLGNSSYEENSYNACFINRVGSSIRGEVCEWDLAPEAPLCSYKLPRVNGSFPASQTFLPLLRSCHVLVRTDNTTVVAYMNQQGGHMLRNITQTGPESDYVEQQAPTVITHRARHQCIEQWGGFALPDVLHLVWVRFGQAPVDLFVLCENAQCLLLFSLRNRDTPLGVDALTHPWPNMLLYAFPQ